MKLLKYLLPTLITDNKGSLLLQVENDGLNVQGTSHQDGPQLVLIKGLHEVIRTFTFEVMHNFFHPSDSDVQKKVWTPGRIGNLRARRIGDEQARENRLRTHPEELVTYTPRENRARTCLVESVTYARPGESGTYMPGRIGHVRARDIGHVRARGTRGAGH